MKLSISYLFQDYFQPEDSVLFKVKCIAKAFVLPAPASAKICVWIRLSRFFCTNKIIRWHFEHKIYKKFNCTISGNALIGKKLVLPHPQNIAIGEGAIIGDNAIIYQGVTIGRRELDDPSYPIIGNNCIIYCNASLLGGIRVEDNAIIGAHTLVLNDIEKGKMAIGWQAGIVDRGIFR